MAESSANRDMTISEVARRVGVRTSTLRYYESIGLLPAPKRVSGRRRYDSAVLQRLEIIRTAQQAGFTLAELASVRRRADECRARRALARADRAQIAGAEPVDAERPEYAQPAARHHALRRRRA
ncbi:MAG: MerR family transcriptional regulator [Anaerolineae bacterium]